MAQLYEQKKFHVRVTVSVGGLENFVNLEKCQEDEEKWNEYSIKTLAFAETKGWVEGLTESNAADDIKKKAKSYLTISLTGKAFKFLNRSKEPKEIWIISVIWTIFMIISSSLFQK